MYLTDRARGSSSARGSRCTTSKMVDRRSRFAMHYLEDGRSALEVRDALPRERLVGAFARDALTRRSSPTAGAASRPSRWHLAHHSCWGSTFEGLSESRLVRRLVSRQRALELSEVLLTSWAPGTVDRRGALARARRAAQRRAKAPRHPRLGLLRRRPRGRGSPLQHPSKAAQRARQASEGARQVLVQVGRAVLR